MTAQELLKKVNALPWTEVKDPKHPWFRETTVRQQDVRELIQQLLKEE